ncbi:MAG: YfjI family protein, partial [Meiothermus sp.]
MTARELLEAPDVLADEVWPEPEPLDGAAKLHPWPVGAILPPQLEDFGLAFADRLCIDPGPVMMTLLAASSALTSGRVWIQPDRDNPTWQEPTSLWLVIVMPIATGKTPILKAALGPVWAVEKTLREEHELALQTYKAELASWESRKRNERGPRPEPPRVSRLLAQDATREALADLLTTNPGLLAYHDELAGLFKT